MSAYVLNLAILLVLLALGAITFHKTRRIHLAILDLKEHTIRRQTDVLFNQLQSLLALEKKLAMKEPLPTTRGWAGSPDFLLRVATEALKRKPKVVLECSSGVSTIVTARCLQINGEGHVYSLEHSSEYAEKTNQLLLDYGLTEWATVLHAPLTANRAGIPWYSTTSIPEDLPPIDMAIVDGPPAVPGVLSRSPALQNLLPRFEQKWLIILDDTNRKEEQQMLKEWKQLNPGMLYIDAHCEKGCTLIEPTTK